MKTFGLLRRDRRGGAIVETAIILPVFFVMLIGLIEITWQFAIAAGLDHGTRRGARWASLGAAPPPNVTRADRVAEIIVRSSGLPINSALLSVTPSSYARHADVNGTGTPGFGGPNDVVKYVITYDSKILTPFGRAFFPTGFMNFRSVVIEQNEPFPQ